MKTPKIQKLKPKPQKPALWSKPTAKPKGIILKPNPNKTDDFETKLEKCDSEIQYFVAALKTENLKLHKQNANVRQRKCRLRAKSQFLLKNMRNIDMTILFLILQQHLKK